MLIIGKIDLIENKIIIEWDFVVEFLIKKVIIILNMFILR